MKLIDQFILKDLIKPFFVALAGAFIIIIGNNMFYYMDMITKSGVPVNTVIALFLYNIPGVIVLAFPIGFLFSSLFVLGRISKDSELTALISCGVSFTRIIRPVLLTAVIISGLSYVFNQLVVPESNHQVRIILTEMLLNPKIFPFKAKVFSEIKGKRAFYAEEVNPRKGFMRDVLIFDNSKSGFPQVINAKTATRSKNRFFLHNGMVKKYDKNGYINNEIKFRRMEIEIDMEMSGVFNERNVSELSSGEAGKRLSELKSRGIDAKSEEVIYYHKFALPLSTFFVSLISAPIGIKFAKRGTYFGVAICIAIVFIWQLFYSIATPLASKGILEPFMAAWIQNIIFAVIGIPLLLYSNSKL